MKRILESVFLTKAVFELRNTHVLVTLLVSIFLGILMFTPFTFMFFELSTYRMDVTNWQISGAEQEIIMAGLPVDCYFDEGRFNCAEDFFINVRQDLSISFGYKEEFPTNGMVFQETSLIFLTNDTAYDLSYNSFNGTSFADFVTTDGYELLFNRVANGLRNELLLTFVLGSYQTGIITFIVFVLGVSALSMLLKFSHLNFINFKQMVNIVVFSSFQMVILVMLVGFIFTPGFTTLIFNFGTPLRAYVVYKREVLPTLVTKN